MIDKELIDRMNQRVIENAENNIKKLTYAQFKDRFMGADSTWDFSKFKILCVKCGSKKVEFNGYAESEGGYYGEHSLHLNIIIKCHGCGNAHTITNDGDDEINFNKEEDLK